MVSSVAVMERQTVELGLGMWFNLGEINGKPWLMKLLPEGFEWSGGKHTGPDLPAGDPAHRTMAVIQELYQVSIGRRTPAFFNDYLAVLQIGPAELESALRRIGVDPARPFAMYDRTFVLEHGRLVEDR